MAVTMPAYLVLEPRAGSMFRPPASGESPARARFRTSNLMRAADDSMADLFTVLAWTTSS